MTINPDLVSLLLVLAIPIATGLLTTTTASNRTKALVAMILTAVVTLVTEAKTGTGAAIISTEMATAWAINLAVQLAAYLGIYKPIAPGAVNLAPTAGLG